VANSLFQILSDFFARYGLWLVFFGVMAENIGFPVPGETVLLFAGFLAYQGKIPILPAIAAVIAGATLGACLGFLLGRCAGNWIVNRFLRRFPRLAREYDNAQRMFLRHGQWAVFVARFITGLRVFAGVLAGALRMSFPTFLAFSFAGAVCWTLAIGSVGYLFGSSWGKLIGFVNRMDRIVLVICGLGVAALIVIQWARRKKRA